MLGRTSNIYVQNYTTLKNYNNKFLTLTTMKSQRVPGYEDADKDEKLASYYATELCPVVFSDQLENMLCVYNKDLDCICTVCYTSEEYFYDEMNKSKKNKKRSGSASEEYERLEQSLSRTRRYIYEYALCNDFKYFATFTIDSKKFDRYDLSSFYRSFSRFMRYFFREKHNTDYSYLIVPELHEDDAIHLHSLMSFDKKFLTAFSLSDKRKLSNYIVSKLKRNEQVYEFCEYSKRYGFNVFEEISDIQKVSAYITKYITKDLSRLASRCNAKLYYTSRHLHKAKIVAQGLYLKNYFSDFENEFCRKATFAYSDEFLQTLLNNFY
ncbi:MAG: hypothetical protein UIM53_00305 [Acutalibacteraceae bacterium]|nr:hypothetical protein [Acutalibacteraceae bacterium]